MIKIIRVTKGSKIETADGRIFDIFGFKCIEYAHHLDQLSVILLARESGIEYIQMGLAMVYNAPTYIGFDVEEWDGAMVDAGRLKIRLERVRKYNRAWRLSFDHCQMTIDPVGGQALDILRRDQLVTMLSLPDKV